MTPRGLAVRLESPNRLTMPAAELAELAGNLNAQLGKADEPVRVDYETIEPLGVGNSFVDFITMILPSAEFMKETAFTTIVGGVTGYMAGRFKRPHEATRPRRIVLKDAAGQKLGTIEVYPPDESESHQG